MTWMMDSYDANITESSSSVSYDYIASGLTALGSPVASIVIFVAEAFCSYPE